MSETTGGGSAFWAARGVRIEPEPADEDLADEYGSGDAVAVVPAQPTDSIADVPPIAEADVDGEAELDANAESDAALAELPDSAEPAILIDSLDPVETTGGLSVAAESDDDSDSDSDSEDGEDDGSVLPGSPVDEPTAAPLDLAVEPDFRAESVVEPEPEPESEPESEPEPVAAPGADHALESSPEADLDTAPDPAAELAPEPVQDLDPLPSAEVAFIPTQATFDEVEPQVGEPVDGLVALNGTLIDAARTKAELAARAAEPVWQLTDDNLTALPDLRTCLESILLVVDEPVTEVVLAQIVERPTEQVAAALRALSAEYTSQGRGFDLREVGIGDGSLITQTGWRFYTRAECAPVVERYIRDGQQSKLTQAALETLAVVGYRQPVSRSKVSAIRGVNCDGVMRTLLARGLVEECGTEYETGALLYRTTGYFLERMGLKGLEELPDLAPLLPSAADLEDEV